MRLNYPNMQPLGRTFPWVREIREKEILYINEEGIL
jgi:hypothetical protein